MKSIKVLGPGCANCLTQLQYAQQAVAQLGIEATVEKISDLRTIMGFGVLSTPGLVVDEKVVAMGRLVPIDEIKKLIG